MAILSSMKFLSRMSLGGKGIKFSHFLPKGYLSI